MQNEKQELNTEARACLMPAMKSKQVNLAGAEWVGRWGRKWSERANVVRDRSSKLMGVVLGILVFIEWNGRRL